MGKTSKTESVQAIDPQQRADTRELSTSAAMLAGMGDNTYQGNTVAAQNEYQARQADAANSFAEAFGMDPAETTGLDGATRDANGNLGYSGYELAGGDSSAAMFDDFYAKLGQPTAEKAPHKVSGGKK